MNEVRGQLLYGITTYWDREIHVLLKTQTLRVHRFTLKNHYFPPIRPYVSFLSVCDCTWNPLLWLDLAVSYVQLSRLHFHPTSDAMWRARTDGSQQLRNMQHQQTPRARERPCLHVQIEELDSWVKSFQHRLLMISNNFCSSAWVQVEQLWSAIQKHPRPGKADTCDECCCFSIFDQCSGNTWCTLLCWRDDVVWF